MARLRNEDWLHLAKGTPVGSQRRVRHGNERTDAMTVGNEPDRWWAKCQRCKAGAVEMKTHVLLSSKEPESSRSLLLPTDALPISLLPQWQQSLIASFLASKHMDLEYFHGYRVTWSASRQRLLFAFSNGTMGRDTSGASPQKWLTYHRQPYEIDRERPAMSASVVLVEDCFSLLKVRHAMDAVESGSSVSVVCTLGTEIHNSLMLRLMKEARAVVSFYDGDGAGWAGARRNATRLRAVGIAGPGGAMAQCAPTGMDPKDMTIADIQRHVEGLLTTS